MSAGTHLVTVLRRGREAFVREIHVTRGGRVDLAAPLVATGRRRAVPWVWGGAGVLGAAALTTGIAGLVHDGRARDVRAQLELGDRPPSDAARYDAEVRARDRAVTATWVLGGAAVGAGAVGALLYLLDTPSPEGLQLAPLAGPASTGAAVGLTLGGRF